MKGDSLYYYFIPNTKEGYPEGFLGRIELDGVYQGNLLVTDDNSVIFFFSKMGMNMQAPFDLSNYEKVITMSKDTFTSAC